MQHAAVLFTLVLTTIGLVGFEAGCGIGLQDFATPATTVGELTEVERCQDASEVYLFASPSVPTVGRPLRILAVTDKPLVGELVVRATASEEKGAASDLRHGGPPYFWVAEVPSASTGSYSARLVQRAREGGSNVASRTVSIAAAAPAEEPSTKGALWPTSAAWSHNLENVYSAWIETLFDAPDGAMPTWSALHALLRDRKRNLLFDHLGAGEDSVDAPAFRPDCADLPYFLRAYFAFKLRLPFGVSECDRGCAGAPPKCGPRITTNEDAAVKYEANSTAMESFGAFLGGTLSNLAHSGSGRVPFDDENSDYYPVPLTWKSLRPGTVYSDPYGHVFVLAKRLPQNAGRGGVLYAVDAQPDGTVARKRFWRGTFLYANERELGGPGWKRFRPLSLIDGKLVRWGDDAIRESPDYGDVSREPGQLGPEAFFDTMDDVLSPKPLDPHRALLEIVGALEELIRTRVESVDSGRCWLATAGSPAAMPGLAELFEASGTWEDYSTPSRDLRLLVAMDYVTGFPAQVARRPTRYAMPEGKSAEEVEKELEALLARELATRRISYPRTDGSMFSLTLTQVLARKTELEVAYNPNDCAEVRWGAPTGSDEEKTCHAHAPPAQQRSMQELRVWFRERRRPPRR